MPSVVVGGSELHYVRAGEGEPLLLIQGMSSTHLTWGRPFLMALERSFDCIAYDHRGTGRSGAARMPFTTADLAGDALGLLDALGIERAHVLGVSMGGMAAQELALAHPDRLHTLTLGATYCGGPEGTLMAEEALRTLSEALASADPERVYRAIWEINLSAAFRADDTRFAEFREVVSEPPAPTPVVAQQMWACGAHDASARLGDVKTPTLVVHGSEDRMLGASNGRQIAALMGARLERLEGVGHMFWWEQPERSAALVRDHALAPTRQDAPMADHR
jgi:pimeloyl-ACP methyl ester carboxylesterase